MGRCRTDTDRALVVLIKEIHSESEIRVGKELIKAQVCLPQGSVLSPILFNVYLEEAIKGSKLLEDIRIREDLLAFADDILVSATPRQKLSRPSEP